MFNVHGVSRAGYPPIAMWLDVIILTDAFYCSYFIFETRDFPVFFRFSPHLLYNTGDKLEVYTNLRGSSFFRKTPRNANACNWKLNLKYYSSIVK
jgi:hypothetical protein